MNCCKDDSNDNDSKKENTHKGHMSHLWMMVLCCGAPVIILLLILLLGSSLSGLRGVLVWLLPFICPLMMIAMIPMMFRKGKEHNIIPAKSETRQIEEKE